MTTLAAKRAELRDALAAVGLFAFSAVPDNATPPLVYVTAADPYISLEGAAFGGVIAHHQLVLVASPGVNEARADELDQMVETTLLAIAPLVGTFEVGLPGSISLDGQAHVGVAITTQTEIHLEEA